MGRKKAVESAEVSGSGGVELKLQTFDIVVKFLVNGEEFGREYKTKADTLPEAILATARQVVKDIESGK